MYPHYLALLVLPWLLLEGAARWLAYGVLLVGGTFAVLPLSEPMNRTVASLVPLAILALGLATRTRRLNDRCRRSWSGHGVSKTDSRRWLVRSSVGSGIKR